MTYKQASNMTEWTSTLLILIVTITVATANSPVPCEIKNEEKVGHLVFCSNVAQAATVISALEQLNIVPVHLVIAASPNLEPTAEQAQNPVFANLETLNLIGNEITEYSPEIEILIPKLHFLGLPYNNLTKIDGTYFPGLNLTTLLLSHNQIAEISESSFRSLVNLDELYLDNNKLTAIPATLFQGLEDLHELHVNGNELTVIDENQFQGLNYLDDLNLANNKISTFDVKTFGNAPRLRKLDLSGNLLQSVDVKLFESNTKLAHLDLSSNQLSNLGNEVLNVPSLKELIIQDNNIETLTEDLFALTPNLVVLNAGDNKLNTTSTSVFAGLTQLKEVYLGGNRIITVFVDGFRKEGSKEGDSIGYALVTTKQAFDCTLPEFVILRKWFKDQDFNFIKYIKCENEDNEE